MEQVTDSGVATLVARLEKLIGDGSFSWLPVETTMLREIVAALRVHAEGVTPAQEELRMGHVRLDECTDAHLTKGQPLYDRISAKLQQLGDDATELRYRLKESELGREGERAFRQRAESQLSALRAAAVPPSTWQADDILLVVSLYNRGYALEEIIRRLEARPVPPAASSGPT